MNIILFGIKESIHLVRFALHFMFIAFRMEQSRGDSNHSSWTILLWNESIESHLRRITFAKEESLSNESESTCLCIWLYIWVMVAFSSKHIHIYAHTNIYIQHSWRCKTRHRIGVGWGLAHHMHYISFGFELKPNIMKDSYIWLHQSTGTKDAHKSFAMHKDLFH